jgi:hypothetical protein
MKFQNKPRAKNVWFLKIIYTYALQLLIYHVQFSKYSCIFQVGKVREMNSMFN